MTMMSSEASEWTGELSTNALLAVTVAITAPPPDEADVCVQIFLFVVFDWILFEIWSYLWVRVSENVDLGNVFFFCGRILVNDKFALKSKHQK